MPDPTCPACGSVEPPGTLFCGQCGDAIPESTPPAAPAPPTPTPPPAVASTPAPTAAPATDGASRGNGLAWGLGGIFVGLGIALVLVAVLVFGAVEKVNQRTSPEAVLDKLPDVSSAPVPNLPIPQLPNGLPLPSPGGVTPAPIGSGAPPTDLSGASAPELDRPESYAYASARSTCVEHAHASDVLKEVGIGIDQQMRSVGTISGTEEKTLGDRYLAELSSSIGGRLVASGPMVDYLTGVAAPLVQHARRTDMDFHFYILEDTDMVNALALPGGHIVVTRPLFTQWVHNEAHLATVLAHEIAHVDNRHPIAIVQYSRALGLPEDDAISQGVIMLAQTPYSSALEEESDRQGVAYMHAAGYSVFQAVALWRERAAESPAPVAAPGGNPIPADDPLGGLLGVALGELEHLLATHPDAARRACLLEQQAHDLLAVQPRAAVYIGVQNLAHRQPMAQRVF